MMMDEAERVGQGLVRVGQGGLDGSFFFLISQKNKPPKTTKNSEKSKKIQKIIKIEKNYIIIFEIINLK
jgi:hypothetical protein